MPPYMQDLCFGMSLYHRSGGVEHLTFRRNRDYVSIVKGCYSTSFLDILVLYCRVKGLVRKRNFLYTQVRAANNSSDRTNSAVRPE